MCTDSARIHTLAALRSAGMSRRRIAARVASGSLEVLRPNAYADVGACTPVRDAARHGGALACVSAARHAGLWVLEDSGVPHVWLRGHGRRRMHDGCRCVDHWDDAPVQDAFGIPSLPRVLRQIFLCRGIEEFFVAVESAMHLGRIGRSGLAWLRTHCGDAVRDAIAFARSDAESGLESLLRWRLRRLGVRLRTQVTIVSVGRVDFLLGDRLILEVDGAGNHDGASRRHRDLIRDAHAAAWGYLTLRFDYAMIVHDWPTVELAILAHVDRGLHLTP